MSKVVTKMKKKNKPIWRDFGILLKTERQRNMLSRTDLAQKVGKKVLTILSWEQGYRRPKQNSLLELRNILGTPIQELQKKAGYTPEFDWRVALTDKPSKKNDVLLSTSIEEKEELRKYLLFMRFKKQITTSQTISNK